MTWVLEGERNSATPIVMKKNPNTHVSKPVSTQPPRIAKRIKLGIDVHADSYRVVRQIENASPQPAQKFSPADFLVWARKQLDQAEEVFSCYEAGPFGYGLHRELEGMGIKNVVVRPQDWDELHRGVKTDKTDALALAQRLAMYVDGNHKALAVVKVPTPEQDIARSQSRFREQLTKHRLIMEAQGRSLLLYHGVRVRGRWWESDNWKEVQKQIGPELIAILKVMRDLLMEVHAQAAVATLSLQKAAKPQSVGIGALSSQVLEREILDWNRFTNRRQVASLTGLCPGVRQSGASSQNGSITRHGNRRIRTTLIEMAWRCLKFQRDYPPLRQRLGVLENSKAVSGAKKKAIVAVARHLAVDLWRINTGRCTAQARGLR